MNEALFKFVLKRVTEVLTCRTIKIQNKLNFCLLKLRI